MKGDLSMKLIPSCFQAAWLRNASIKGQFSMRHALEFTQLSDVDNILFNLPFDEERYQKTLEVSCEQQ